MIAWLVQTLVASMLLMAIVLMLRAPVSRLFGPRIAYALWLLPALRMILPPLPGWTALFVPVAVVRPDRSMIGLADTATAAKLAPAIPVDPAGLTAQVTPMPVLDAGPSAAVAIQISQMLITLWLGVAALYFSWQLLRYRLFLRRALRGAVPLTTECGVEVLVSPELPGPVAIGIVRRRILLPSDFLARYTPEERRLALLHEAAHHDRLDIAANLAALAIRSLHWWNPLAHKAYSAFRADQELACDATVLAGTAPEQRIVYGRALLKSAAARMPAMACALNPKNQLRQRIGMMARPVGRARLLFGAAVALTMIGAGMIATASGFALPPSPPAPPVAPPALPHRPMVSAMPPAPSAAPVARAPHVGAEPATMPAVKTAAVLPTPPAPPAPLPAPAILKAPPPPPAPAAPLARASQDQPCPEERRAAREAEAEARRDAREGLREARQAQREAAREAAAAQREAAAAQREAAAARREALAEARTAQARIPAMVQTSLASARRGMLDACARQGVTLSADADWNMLATCGPKLRRTIRASLASVRTSLAANPALPAKQRSDALSGLDDALADLDRALPGQ
ncbi:M56 family metallopeptidase [Flavisphingomonas formosensis]|uniref:M56 family metallopeptidase n=1 Tax=Flavisphingomonas formosensis TaxID=861534 RepID=UPI0012F91E6D|nr:M56 family metallopeptidase [Sphingomonas formosensis]